MTERTTVVLGATGKTGRRVLARLRATGRPARGVSRSTPIRFAWGDPTTWADAVRDAGAMYLVAPEEPADLDGFVRTAVAAGVERLVLLSAREAERFNAEGVLAGERAVRASGVSWTILRPSNFAQNFDEDLFLEPLLAGRLALPLGWQPEPFVDVLDIADVAVEALTRDGHHGRTYLLSGPEGVAFPEAVAMIARTTDREIRYVEQTPEEYAAEQRAAGLPEEWVRTLGLLWDIVREGHVAKPETGVQEVLDREASRFADYVVRTAVTGVWNPA